MMTLFTARDTLTAARRGVSKRLCLCCGDWHHPDDMASADDWTHADDLVRLYGSMPCIACADDHQRCAMCGTVRPSAEMIDSDDGPICPRCKDEPALERDNMRAEVRAWERQR